MNAESLQRPREFRGFVANCLLGGGRIVRTGETFSQSPLEFDCGGFRFEFYQNSDTTGSGPDGLQGQFSTITEVIVEGVHGSQVVEVKEVLDRICWLLSFIAGCRVICYGYEYPNGTGLGKKISVSGVASLFRPVFDLKDGSRIKIFIEQVFDSYARLENPRKLNVVFDYLAQADAPGQLLEMRSLLSFVALECLKHSFAMTKGIRFEEGYFRRPDWQPGKKGKSYSFKQLVKMMLKEFGMKQNLNAACTLRNDLIHSGLSSESYARQTELYEAVYDLIREYLLRLLGYRGTYTPYAIKRRGAVVEIR